MSHELKVWRTDCFHGFLSSPQLPLVFLQFNGNMRTCFLSLLENSVMKERKQLIYTLITKMYKFSLLVPSLRQQLVLVPCFCRLKKCNIKPIGMHIFFQLFSKL